MSPGFSVANFALKFVGSAGTTAAWAVADANREQTKAPSKAYRIHSSLHPRTAKGGTRVAGRLPPMQQLEDFEVTLESPETCSRAPATC